MNLASCIELPARKSAYRGATLAADLRSGREESEIVSRTRWNNRFSVGIERIDAQLKTLFGYIADLEKSVDNPDERQRWRAIDYAFVRLREYNRLFSEAGAAPGKAMATPAGDLK